MPVLTTKLFFIVITSPLFIYLLNYFGLNKPPSKQPHIVVIIADDMGWNDVSFHGADQIFTPNIDALAYNGVILNRHYVQPLCTPSRAALLTGHHPIEMGLQGLPLSAGDQRGVPLNFTLLPEYLRDLGYTTHLVGKHHIGHSSNDYLPTRRGFDSFLGYYTGFVQYFLKTQTWHGQTGYDFHRDTNDSFTIERNLEYMTKVISNETAKIISNHNKHVPLFLQIAHLAPHASDNVEPLEVPNARMLNESFGYIKDRDRQRFAGVMKELDDFVGTVVSALKDANMLENSIVLFIADNGGQTIGFARNHASNYPLRGLKGSVFEGAVRGAACIYSPLISKLSRVSNELLHITDWLPTFYSAAGGNVRDLGAITGVSQWQTLTSSQKSPRDLVLINIDETTGTEAAMSGLYKYVKGTGETLPKRVYKDIDISNATNIHKIDFPIYEDYYGDSGMDSLYPLYNVSAVLSSPAGQAIACISKTKLDASKSIELRKESQVTCERKNDFPSCKDGCLFDVSSNADECETRDISSSHPKVVKKLQDFIKEQHKLLVNQVPTIIDPAALPNINNGIWGPWLPEKGQIMVDRSLRH